MGPVLHVSYGLQATEETQLKQNQSLNQNQNQSLNQNQKSEPELELVVRGVFVAPDLWCVLTRVAVVGEGEGGVAMLVVAQRPDGWQSGLKFGLGRDHVDRRLTRPATIREELGPLRLADVTWREEVL